MVTRFPPLPAATPVVIDGTTIATRVLEPGGEPSGDVVLCHGTPWSSQVWSRVAHELSRDRRVLLWDMPGYGESEKGPSVATDLRTQAARLSALLRAWGVFRPSVVAHDIGGAVALRAHLMHEAEYADLFLWDIVTLDPWGSPFFRLVADNADVFSQLPANLHTALVTEYISGATATDSSGVDVDALASIWTDAAGQHAFYRQIASLSATDTRSVVRSLGDVRCPVRIGWGAEDPWIPVGQAHELQAALPGRPDVIVLDGVGHLAPCEAPFDVVAALREWLDRASAG